MVDGDLLSKIAIHGIFLVLYDPSVVVCLLGATK